MDDVKTKLDDFFSSKAYFEDNMSQAYENIKIKYYFAAQTDLEYADYFLDEMYKTLKLLKGRLSSDKLNKLYDIQTNLTNRFISLREKLERLNSR